MPNNAGDNTALSSSVSGSILKFVAPEGYYDGVDDVVEKQDLDFVAGNIVNGKDIFGITGTFDGYYASGSVAGSSSGLSFTLESGGSQSSTYINVTGLSFTPKIIVVWESNTELLSTYTDVAFNLNGNGRIYTSGGTFNIGGNATVTSSSFQIPCDGGASSTLYWKAWG